MCFLSSVNCYQAETVLHFSRITRTFNFQHTDKFTWENVGSLSVTIWTANKGVLWKKNFKLKDLEWIKYSSVAHLNTRFSMDNGENKCQDMWRSFLWWMLISIPSAKVGSWQGQLAWIYSILLHAFSFKTKISMENKTCGFWSLYRCWSLRCCRIICVSNFNDLGTGELAACFLNVQWQLIWCRWYFCCCIAKKWVATHRAL